MDSDSPRWNQPWFPPLDGMSMNAMVTSRKPKKYIGIGSGHSTKFAMQAIRDHGLDTEVISVDPSPRAEVDNICSQVIRKPLEEATGLEGLLQTLTPGDIVFLMEAIDLFRIPTLRHSLLIIFLLYLRV